MPSQSQLMIEYGGRFHTKQSRSQQENKQHVENIVTSNCEFRVHSDKIRVHFWNKPSWFYFVSVRFECCVFNSDLQGKMFGFLNGVWALTRGLKKKKGSYSSLNVFIMLSDTCSKYLNLAERALSVDVL